MSVPENRVQDLTASTAPSIARTLLRLPTLQEDSVPAESCDVIDEWLLSDGTKVCVRLLNAEDRALEVAFLNSLSDQSRYFRLLTPSREISADLLSQLLDLDDNRRAALVALIGDAADMRIIAVARYAATNSAGSAEIGVTVADEWHRKGIAERLIKLLSHYAKKRSIVRFEGIVLPENHAMLALARKLGFILHFDAEKHLFVMERDLN